MWRIFYVAEVLLASEEGLCSIESDLTEKTQRYYEIYTLHLPIRMAATAVTAMCTHSNTVFESNSNL